MKRMTSIIEEVLCTIASKKVPSTEEEVSKGDHDRLMIEKESKSIIQENILINSDPYTSDQEAAIVNEVLSKTNKDVAQTVQEEIVQIAVQKKKVIKHHKVTKPNKQQ